MGFWNHTSNYFHAVLLFYLRTGPLGVMHYVVCEIFLGVKIWARHPLPI